MPATAYEDLTYRGQVGRMRALARTALPRFGLRKDTKLLLCGHGENTVFAVPGPTGMRYALRVHRLEYQTPAAIESEMSWLTALQRDSSIPVPRPRKGKDGLFVQRVAHAGVPGTRSVALLSWIHGRRVGRNRGDAYQGHLGHLMGHLHEHASQWRPPRDFTRRAWDERELLIAPAWGDPLEAPGLRQRDRELFLAARDKAVSALRAFGKDRTRWGLIHADLHGGNIIRRNGRLCPIDFDDCGFGWFLFDIMIAAASPYWGTPRYEPMMNGFLESYTEVRTLDVRDLERMEDFIVTRALDLVGWLANRRDNPMLANLIPRMIRHARNVCKPYAS